MKRGLTKFLAIGSVALLMLASCKKNDAIVTANDGKAGILTASSTSIILVKANDTTTTPVVTFSFTQASYGYKAAITNTLQIDTAGDNWANPVSVTLSTGVLAYSYNTADLNTLALKLNIKPTIQGEFLVRIAHSISTAITPVYSNVLTVNVTPYSTVIPANYWYVPGSYDGWSTTTADSLRETMPGSKIFTGVIAFTGDLMFKVVPTKAGFTGNLGDGGGGTTAANVYTTTVTSTGGNITALSVPTVDPAVNITTNMVTLDLNKSTISVTPDLWSVVGSGTAGSWPNSTGYQDDVDMKFNNGTQTWSVVVPLTGGGNQIKFRRNHDWGVNYGGDSGVISLGGDNINVPANGTYLVTLDLVHNTYSLVKQ